MQIHITCVCARARARACVRAFVRVCARALGLGARDPGRGAGAGNLRRVATLNSQPYVYTLAHQPSTPHLQLSLTWDRGDRSACTPLLIRNTKAWEGLCWVAI